MPGQKTAQGKDRQDYVLAKEHEIEVVAGKVWKLHSTGMLAALFESIVS